jgi:hypothetical protein
MTVLISLNEFKTYEGIAGNTDDIKLNLIIPSVSALVRNYCGKTFNSFVAVDKVELFSPRYPMDIIWPSETPINSIVSLEVDYEGSGTYTVVPSTEYGHDARLDLIRLKNGAKFPVGVNSVKFTYRGGYASIPPDLKLALIDLINYYMKNEHIPEKNHATFTIRHEDGKASFPDHIKRVLDLYKDG